MEHKPITRSRMRANVSLAIAGVLGSLSMVILDYPTVTATLIFGLVLSLAGLGTAFYQVWLWKHYPSPAQESVVDAVRNRTALWVGITGCVVFCVMIFIQSIQ